MVPNILVEELFFTNVGFLINFVGFIRKEVGIFAQNVGILISLPYEAFYAFLIV